MTLTEARNNKKGFAGLRTKRTEIPVGTPWNCLHSSATNANFFTIRAQGLRSTYPNQLSLQCETQFSFDRTGKFHNMYTFHVRIPISKCLCIICIGISRSPKKTCHTILQHQTSGRYDWKTIGFFNHIFMINTPWKIDGWNIITEVWFK